MKIQVSKEFDVAKVAASGTGAPAIDVGSAGQVVDAGPVVKPPPIIPPESNVDVDKTV